MMDETENKLYEIINQIPVTNKNRKIISEIKLAVQAGEYKKALAKLEEITDENREEIEEFGKRKGIVKCSRRDLPIVFATKSWGATTVAATMFIASLANIEFFVTGGIGGAHRKANETFDISTDLEELGRTNVSVICAGPKAILDLGLTLEIASIIKAKRDNKLDGGVLITNPVDDEHSLDEEKIEKVIEKAIEEMEEKGVRGKEETPFLLSKIVELTEGKSLETNIALVLNNAKLGAKIAKEYYSLNK